MTEKELVAVVAEQTNQTKVVVKEILDALADAIVEVGSKEESVRIAEYCHKNLSNGIQKAQ